MRILADDDVDALLSVLGVGGPATRAQNDLPATTIHPDRATLLGAAVTLASIVLPRPIIKAALEEAAMPVPVRDTPLGRELYDEGRQEGRRTAAVEMTAALLEERFGADERIPLIAQRLADLDDRARVRRIAAAATIEELAAL